MSKLSVPRVKNTIETMIRTSATGNYATEIEQENDIRPINLVNEE